MRGKRKLLIVTQGDMYVCVPTDKPESIKLVKDVLDFMLELIREKDM